MHAGAGGYLDATTYGGLVGIQGPRVGTRFSGNFRRFNGCRRVLGNVIRVVKSAGLSCSHLMDTIDF